MWTAACATGGYLVVVDTPTARRDAPMAAAACSLCCVLGRISHAELFPSVDAWSRGKAFWRSRSMWAHAAWLEEPSSSAPLPRRYHLLLLSSEEGAH